MNKNMFQTPISIHIFNRPQPTKKLFDVIKKIRPQKLFITADGPRDGNPNDLISCNEVREIFTKIDWECKIYKNFSDVNKGAFKSTSDGISWVFKNVDKAIILEDDCIPHETFFPFCEKLLNYYENDSRISIISGNNFQLNKNRTNDSYYFSRYTHIWGWATWKRTWEHVDFSMKNWPEYKRINGLKSTFSQRKEIKYWSEEIFQAIYDEKRKPHWDFLLSLSSYMNNTLAVIPNVNLVSNIGFGPDANITIFKTKFHEIKSKEISFPLKHPEFVSRYIEADSFTEKTRFSGAEPLIKKMLRKLLPKSLWSFIKKIKIMLLK